MRSVVTPDWRRLITTMMAARIPTPTRIVNQSDIVCSLLRTQARCASESSCRHERQGRGPDEGGGPDECFRGVLLGITRMSVRKATGARQLMTAQPHAVCSPASRPLGIGRVQTVLAESSVQLRARQAEPLRRF